MLARALASQERIIMMMGAFRRTARHEPRIKGD